MDVYKTCPAIENGRYLLRLVKKKDAGELLGVYGDKKALPFFNSDNCHGDNFYYPTQEKMEQAIDFWLRSYETGWFVRWTIIDKADAKAIGTIEMFRRTAEDDFDGVGVLRLDLKSDREETGTIQELLELFVPQAYELFGCDKIITKVPLYAVDRMDAVRHLGFERSASLLIGADGRSDYDAYWTIQNDRHAAV